MCARHEMGEWHPERPARLHAIAEAFVDGGLARVLHRMPAPLATALELERVHRADYVAAIDAASPESGYTRLDPDTALNPYSVEAAYRADSAWCPGGRTMQNALSTVRAITASVAETTAPAARYAASTEYGFSAVSGSSRV